MNIKLILLALVGILSMQSCGAPSQKDNQKQEAKNGERKTETKMEITGEEISYSADTTTLEGYIAYPAENPDQKVPGVLVVHEWWGHNEYARMRADMLAELGYVALAVDMYGDGKKADHPEDAGKFAGMVMSNLDAAKARFDAALSTLKKHGMVDTSDIAAIGYCFGGSVVLSMANAGYDLDAVAAFHSGVQLPIPPSDKIQAKVLVANGADDPFITEDQESAYKQAMDSVGADYEYINYSGAVHSFTNPAADSFAAKFDMPVAYNEEADNKSWNAMKELFNRVFN